jgi:hypothetical protein
MTDEFTQDELSDFVSSLQLPEPYESISPVDPEQLKFIIHATLSARKLHPQGEVGFDAEWRAESQRLSAHQAAEPHGGSLLPQHLQGFIFVGPLTAGAPEASACVGSSHFA